MGALVGRVGYLTIVALLAAAGSAWAAEGGAAPGG
jgi:hypothetical protein